jgi:hypothetical protein
MNFPLSLVFSLAGSLCAASALAAGEALRTADEPFRRRLTARMVLSLVLLGCALVSSALELLGPAPGGGSASGLGLLLLAAASGATLWAYWRGPPRRGNESLRERLTRRGLLALGLLALALFVAAGGGRALAKIAPLKDLFRAPRLRLGEQFQALGRQAVSILAVVGLFLVMVGTGTAVALFRSRSPLLPGQGFGWKRLSGLAKGTLCILGLALAVVALASVLSSVAGMFLSLALLALGIVTGAIALLPAFRSDPPGGLALGGISPRGWVSLALLGLSGVVLATQDARILAPPGDRAVRAERSKPGSGQPTSIRSVQDQPSAWSLRLGLPPPPPDPKRNHKSTYRPPYPVDYPSKGIRHQPPGAGGR